MLVKIADVIKELRNVSAFAVILCAIWIISSVTLQSALKHRADIEDLFAYYLLVHYSEDVAICGHSEQVCRRVISDPWLSEFFELQTKDIDFANLRARRRITLIGTSMPLAAWEVRVKVLDPPTDLFKTRLITSPFERYWIVEYPEHKYGVLKADDYENEIFLSAGPRRAKEIDLWLGSLGQVIPNGIDNLTLEDPVFGKLVHDFIQDESGRETVAGIGIPLHYVPLVIATLVLICEILLVGTASALWKAEEFPESSSKNLDGLCWKRIVVLAAGSICWPVSYLCF
jgi:hypothetical protein